MIRETAGGVEIRLRVIPRSRKSEIGGTRTDAVLVRVAAPPVEGAANDALVEFLADRLGVPRRALRIVTGERSRQKCVVVDGITLEAARARLGI